MAHVFVYGIAMTANVLANLRKRSPNIFWSVVQFYTNNYCTICKTS